MMNFFSACSVRNVSAAALSLLAWLSCQHLACANPTGGNVVQGAATIPPAAPQMTIVQTSANAFINWTSFNIDAGQTVTFNQPSSSSVTWNYINDPNAPSASTINGALNANGYVVLQNPNGFAIGGTAAITVHGLIMTTASTPAFNFSGGGPWEFDAPPPAANIINYGRINITGGGSAFLIASDIENLNDGIHSGSGTISAPGGKIGLYAGEKVLVSTSPDGRGLSAVATVPQGLINNQGQLIADAGSITLNAQTVNQGGLVQANSAKNVNGTIELMAGDAVNLDAKSDIEAHGDNSTANAGANTGGSVTIKSENTYSDQIGSTINISGGLQGGNGGSVEISAPSMTALNTKIIGQAQPGWIGGTALLDPDYIVLDQYAGDSVNVNGTSGSVLAGDSPGNTLYLDVGTSDYGYSDSAFIGLSQITLQAKYDITLNDGAVWDLSDSTGQSSGLLNLQAGRNIIFGDGSEIFDANTWSVSLQAGYDFVNNVVQSGVGSIYIGDFDGSNPLDNSGSIQMAAGSISLTSGQDIMVGSGGVTTIGGGSIDVTAIDGTVNTGTSTSGFNYIKKAPYFTPFSVNKFTGTVGTSSTLGGISTAAGGDVTINAGADVISYLPFGTGSSATGDAGTGAFGSQAGNVTINAGGSVYGHYVVVNGTGIINAGQDIGNADNNVALSLVAGSWSLNAGWNPATQMVDDGVGNIFLQEVRNPNGIFNVAGASSGPGYHFFDYDPSASVDLTAGNGVYLTGLNVPRASANGSVDDIQIIMPPSLTISAGSGGVTLENDFTLFPSSYGDLQITTADGGNFDGETPNGNDYTLLMSDSSRTQWFTDNSGVTSFGSADHGSTPVELNNYDPVLINISGSMNNVVLQTTKETWITVGGDMTGCSFYGQNLHAGDVTSINVTGQIFNPGSFNYVTLNQGIQNVPLTDLPLNTLNNWQTALTLAVDSAADVIANPVPASIVSSPSEYVDYIKNNGGFLFGTSLQSSFAYDPTTQRLTFIGSMSPTILNDLTQPLTVLRYGPNGYPLVDSNGHFVTDTINWVAPTAIQTLFAESQGAPSPENSGGGYVVGGTGEFDISAGSISLGNSYGILSLGNGKLLGTDYSYLASELQNQPGATINVTIDSDVTVNGVTTSSLNMPSSTIAALGGGDVNVTSTGGSMDLGSQYLVDFESVIMSRDNLGLGIYTSGGGNVNVTAQGTINIDSSRIATFNGGNVNVESFMGDVNAGSGGNVYVPINVFSTKVNVPNEPFEDVFANGIVAETLVDNSYQVPPPGSATVPGNITVTTPQGSIYSSLGGILQVALNGNISAGPTVTLTAGSPGYIGNIDVSGSGVIGGTVNLTANGNIKGLVISRQNSSVNAAQSFSGTVLSGGTANLSAGGTVSGTIIGATGVNASGGGGVSATILTQSASVNGGAAKSTLGTTANTTSATQSAAVTANSDAKQQVVTDNTEDNPDKKKHPTLQRMKRVTVILPKAS
jgi:filamentous hemagglutinin family protein